MPDTLVVALQIAFIGMLLVFLSILMFWLIISLLVKATAERVEPVVGVPNDAEQERKRRAAATAVAIALALESEARPRVLTPLPTPIVSAWQAVLRSSILDKRGPVR